MTEQAVCELCGDPMPDGEEMFKYHGYSGPCPKPKLPKPPKPSPDPWREIEKLARKINPNLPTDLSGYELRITLSKDFQGVELISNVYR